MMKYAAGFDIGGTKCAVVLGRIVDGERPEIISRKSFETKTCGGPYPCIEKMLLLLEESLTENPSARPETLGISCGGPLDPVRGIIQSPPNLPGWDDVPIVNIVSERTGMSVKLQNDANACAIAEWKFGAGRGTQNMIFLTFGTGMGAGIIVNGAILNGASGMAGECGHIRLAPNGPVGYGKNGSFEGFCSGGGLAQQGRDAAESAIRAGQPLPWCPSSGQLEQINARMLADAARSGDKTALQIWRECGTRLGEGLSILMDLLNPEKIVIGSIFVRAEDLLRPAMEQVLEREALPHCRKACRIVPAELGESIGDIAAISAGLDEN